MDAYTRLVRHKAVNFSFPDLTQAIALTIREGSPAMSEPTERLVPWQAQSCASVTGTSARAPSLFHSLLSAQPQALEKEEVHTLPCQLGHVHSDLGAVVSKPHEAGPWETPTHAPQGM